MIIITIMIIIIISLFMIMSTFDVADCRLESWHTYTDWIKKNWVIRLIDEKRELQREILDLQQKIEKLNEARQLVS
jgi:hypothetical protein